MKIDQPHFHTKDKGRHLSPCLRKKCDGLTDPSPNSPVVEITKHQVEHLHDPLAKQSQHISVSSMNMHMYGSFNCKNNNNAVIDPCGDGDGDIWVEVLCKNTKTGEIRSYFKSTKDPNRRVKDEPPTGASRVIFLRPSYIEKYSK